MTTTAQKVSHTPGPWKAATKPSSVVGWPVVQPGVGRSICSVTYVQRNKIDPRVPGDFAFNRESEANARLIAAAPELLEAARVALGHLTGGMDGEWRGEDDPCEILRAAIAKAEGTEQ